MNTFKPATARTLQLDIDTSDDLVHFHKSLTWFSCITHEHDMKILAIEYRASRRKFHYHVTITLAKRMRLMERIALQAILGSDRTRELCNWERVKCRSTHPILFIEREKGKHR